MHEQTTGRKHHQRQIHDSRQAGDRLERLSDVAMLHASVPFTLSLRFSRWAVYRPMLTDTTDHIENKIGLGRCDFSATWAVGWKQHPI
jgi:hypothetical protein